MPKVHVVIEGGGSSVGKFSTIQIGVKGRFLGVVAKTPLVQVTLEVPEGSTGSWNRGRK